MEIAQETTNYHSITDKKEINNLSPNTISVTSSIESISECSRIKSKAITSAFTFVLALLVHTSLEGFAFGLQVNNFKRDLLEKLSKSLHKI